MTHDVTAAAEHLAEVLAQENAALEALDLRGAAGMAEAKRLAAAAFLAALPGSRAPSAELARRLGALAQENNRRLEHALTVQRRIIGMIAQAVRGTTRIPRYGSTGAMAVGRPPAFTLSARA